MSIQITDGQRGEVERLADLMADMLTLGEARATPIQEKDATVTANVKVASSWRNETRTSPPASDGQQSVITKPSPTAKTPPHPSCKEQNLVTDKIIGGEQREVEKLTDLMPDILTRREARVHVASSVTANTAA
ncbi:uncharacterized protein LOC134255000 [Saccostrea cucullata]|uniref:uncharacterized protein LOC134255000 n=1 Tax=Saccostrea cuccullata TaxID=36930 RepID=UPI002ED61E2D